MEKHYLKLLMVIVILLFACNKGVSQETQNPTKPKSQKQEFNMSVRIFPIPLNPSNLVFENFNTL
jgi:hypothetical protein